MNQLFSDSEKVLSLSNKLCVSPTGAHWSWNTDVSLEQSRLVQAGNRHRTEQSRPEWRKLVQAKKISKEQSRQAKGREKMSTGEGSDPGCLTAMGPCCITIELFCTE